MPSDKEPDKSKPKGGKIRIRTGQPVEFEEGQIPPSIEAVSAERRNECDQVAKTIGAYARAAKQLLSGKYAQFREQAPAHLRESCSIFVLCCANGILVRWDAAKEGEVKVRFSVSGDDVTTLAPYFSDFVVHFPPDKATYDPGPLGPRLSLVKGDLVSGASQEVETVRLLIYGSLGYPDAVPPLPPPHKPRPFVSLTNEIQVMMGGVVMPADPEHAGALDRAREFVARGVSKLPVGWQVFEVYPPFDHAYWNPDSAGTWAETDILGAIASKQFADAQFGAIDPYIAARKAFREMIASLNALLDGPEEPAHQFLRQHPALLSPTHIAGWSKLPLGDRVTDFVFREPPNNYLLVELESPLRELFRKDGQQREELTHAVNQILDWCGYIEDNLQAVQKLGLTGMSSNPESLIVIGRSSSLTDENRRKIVTLQNQNPKLKILTYDDLIQSTKATAENLFGPLDITGQNLEIAYLQP